LKETTALVVNEEVVTWTLYTRYKSCIGCDVTERRRHQSWEETVTLRIMSVTASDWQSRGHGIVSQLSTDVKRPVRPATEP